MTDVCGPSPLSSTVSIPVSLRPVKNARTWIAENGVVIAGPRKLRVPSPERRGGGVAIRLASARGVFTGPSAEFGLNVRGGSVSKRASSTTTATVTTMAASAFNMRTVR